MGKVQDNLFYQRKIYSIYVILCPSIFFHVSRETFLTAIFKTKSKNFNIFLVSNCKIYYNKRNN